MDFAGRKIRTGCGIGKECLLKCQRHQGIILHTDRGSQAFEDFINSRGIAHSFIRKGNLYDNAGIESFHTVLKKGEIFLHTYQGLTESCRAIFEYMEGRYNRK